MERVETVTLVATELAITVLVGTGIDTLDAMEDNTEAAEVRTLPGAETKSARGWAASVETARRRRAQMADNLELRMRAMAWRTTG